MKNHVLLVLSMLMALSACDKSDVNTNLKIPVSKGDRIYMCDGLNYSYDSKGNLSGISGTSDAIFADVYDIDVKFQTDPIRIVETSRAPGYSDEYIMSDIVQDASGRLVSYTLTGSVDSDEEVFDCQMKCRFEYSGDHLVLSSFVTEATIYDVESDQTYTYGENADFANTWEDGNLVRCSASIDYEEVWPDGTDESSYEFINEFFYSDVKNTFRRLEPLEASYIGLDYCIEYAFAQLGYFGAGSEDLVSEIKEDGQVVVRTTYDLNDNGSISYIYADFSNDVKTVYEYSYLPTKALLFTPSVRKEPGVDVPYAPKKGRMKHCRGYYR